MGFSYIIIGFIFLYNPNINIIDLIPDFIGWIFILKGLSKLSFLESRLEESRACATRLALVSGAKLILMFFSNGFDNSTLLLFSFSFSVIELIMFLNFIGKFLDGISYLSMRQADDVVSKEDKSAKFAIILFFSMRSLVVLLPEIIAIINEDQANTMSLSSSQVMLPSKNFTTTLCVCFVLIFGIYSGVIFTKYLNLYRKNSSLNSRLNILYFENVLSNEPLQIKLKTKMFIFIAFLFIFFQFDFYIDKICITPDFIAYIMLLYAVFAARRFIPTSRTFKWLLFGAALVSSLSFANRIIYLDSLSSSFVNEFYSTPFAIILGFADAIFYIFISLQLIKLVKECSQKYAGMDSSKQSRIACVIICLSAIPSFMVYSFPNVLSYSFSVCAIAMSFAIIFYCYKYFFAISEQIGNTQSVK